MERVILLGNVMLEISDARAFTYIPSKQVLKVSCKDGSDCDLNHITQEHYDRLVKRLARIGSGVEIINLESDETSEWESVV